MIWTDAIKADMIRRWKAGDSAGIIAKALGVTRETVMGRIWRAGLRRGHPLPIVKLPYKPRPKTMLAKPHRKPSEPLGVRLGPPVPLMDLKPSMCRYPLGETESPDFGFCGNATEPGRSYCWACQQICFAPVPARKQRAA